MEPSATFCDNYDEDLSKFDEDGAWPVVIDDFVQATKENEKKKRMIGHPFQENERNKEKRERERTCQKKKIPNCVQNSCSSLRHMSAAALRRNRHGRSLASKLPG